MICRGKLIEIQSSELSSKYGLIAKCMFINNLLKVANLSEKCLCSDPAFLQNESKAIIKFNDIKGNFFFQKNNPSPTQPCKMLKIPVRGV
jgi:hypothetical protein